MASKEIIQIFKEIDSALVESLSAFPITFSESHFRKKYNEIRRRWLGNDII